MGAPDGGPAACDVEEVQVANETAVVVDVSRAEAEGGGHDEGGVAGADGVASAVGAEE